MLRVRKRRYDGGTSRSQREGFGDSIPLALSMGGGTISQGMQVDLDAGKGRKLYSPTEPPEQTLSTCCRLAKLTTPCEHLDVRLSDL